VAIERQKIILISGVVLGIVAVLMTKGYLDQQKQAAKEEAKKTLASLQANQTAVLIAKQDIAKGAAIGAEMLETTVVPNKFVQPQAVTSLDRVSGMMVVAPISKGEQITFSKLVSAKQATGGDLAGLTPAGKRAVAVTVDNMSSLSGMLKPGDYVDVIATLQVPLQGPEGQQTNQMAVMPLFQNVLVLAIGRNTGTMQGPTGRYAKEEFSGGPVLVTLALSPQEASFAAFVQEQGKIRFTLRSPADAGVEQVIPANMNTLFQYLMPQSPETGLATEQEVVPEATVEIYRGSNKERIPLSK
jgi:pilus assembly protein CpaB